MCVCVTDTCVYTPPADSRSNSPTRSRLKMSSQLVPMSVSDSTAGHAHEDANQDDGGVELRSHDSGVDDGGVEVSHGKRCAPGVAGCLGKMELEWRLFQFVSALSFVYDFGYRKKHRAVCIVLWIFVCVCGCVYICLCVYTFASVCIHLPVCI